MKELAKKIRDKYKSPTIEQTIDYLVESGIICTTSHAALTVYFDFKERERKFLAKNPGKNGYRHRMICEISIEKNISDRTVYEYLKHMDKVFELMK